ncbi:tyrosine aminotransferase [Oopsacas minuta]|uniref:kynurenine--oxoglutarate transaminase n=1 Tax=Oopsacas minuta TaxID=111878 RepID=A0AAV7JIG2_9METZ|nr:tyrosine aminotransferase [Oopsacas minuta]
MATTPSTLQDPFSLHSQLISQHQSIDLCTPSSLFSPSASYLEALHAITLDPYKHQYSGSRGNPALLQAIAQLYSKLLSRELDSKNDILVSAGVDACMTEVFITFLNPGEEVILIEPIQPLVRSQIRHARGVPVCVSLSDGEINYEKLRKAFSSKTKIVLLSCPSIFTNKLYSSADLKSVANLCEEFDTLCVVDERFENLVFEDQLERIYSLPGMWDRTISVHSGDILFGVPSMRIGWVIGDGEFINQIMKAHVMVIFHTPTPTQLAVSKPICDEVSADLSHSWLSQSNNKARIARDEMFSVFKEAGLVPILPVASYYMLVDVSNLCVEDNSSPVEEMIKRGIGCLPMSVFSSCKSQRNIIVVSFLQPPSVLEALSNKLALVKSTI